MVLKAHAGNKQLGAAMIEFIVGATFFLVPLYLAIQAMGKFADVKYTADAAARYAAWERTVWYEETSSAFYANNRPNQKSDLAIKNEIALRLLNDRNGALQYKAQDKNGSAFVNGTDPLWKDTSGKAYLKEFSQLQGSGNYSKPAKDFLGSAISAVNLITIPSFTGQLAPPVPNNTLAGTAVKFSDVAKDSDVYKRLWNKKSGLPEDWDGIDVTGQAGILSNTWAANSNIGTKNMVKASVPTANGLGDAVELGAKVLLTPWDLLVMPRLDMGKIGVDVVPPDRLK